MSSENALSGKDGKFSVDGTDVARCTQWSVQQKTQASEWGDSDGGGYTNRLGGRKDCTFNAEGKFDTNSEVWDLFEAGDVCAAILYLNSGSLNWNFPRALCSDFQLTVNIDTGDVVGWTSSWGSDGTYTPP